MSWFDVTTLTCPSCGKAFETGTAETINVTRMPWAKEQILAGQFHRVVCPHCDAMHTLDRSFLYTDMTHGHFVLVFPNEQVGEWPELEQVAARAFFDVVESGPPLVQAMAATFRVRQVFGLRDLGDKLRLWEAGLDDALVEVMKLELVTRTPELGRRADLRLSVAAVLDSDDQLAIAAWSHDGASPEQLWSASLARYRELEQRRAELAESFPGLFFKPFVSYRRLAREEIT